jgi:hypothetical protein
VFRFGALEQRQHIVAVLHHVDDEQIRRARDDRGDRLGGHQETDARCTVASNNAFERLVLFFGAPDVRDTDLGQSITPVGALGKQAPRPR